MARWKLATPHYLNVAGEEWEYIENDRKTGRPQRRKFPVPRMLDPADPTSWTSRWGTTDNEDGEIIVCHEGKGASSDITFFGDPTPDMVPMDDEAKALSKTFADKWNCKPETMSADGFSQSLVNKLQAQMDMVATPPAAPAYEGMGELLAAMTAMVKSNVQVAEAMASNTRRV